MAIGRHISLIEAIREGLVKRFAKQHPTECDEEQLDRVLSAMIKTPPSDGRTSARKKGRDG